MILGRCRPQTMLRARHGSTFEDDPPKGVWPELPFNCAPICRTRTDDSAALTAGDCESSDRGDAASLGVACGSLLRAVPRVQSPAEPWHATRSDLWSAAR
jgi:hypothetical protein